MKRGVYLTDIERKMKQALTENKINFAVQFPVRPVLNLDFAIFPEDGAETWKIDVETDGEAWHSSKKQKSYDRRRNYVLKSKGWTVLRFPGQRVLNDIESCIKEIKNTIKKLKEEKIK